MRDFEVEIAAKEAEIAELRAEAKRAVDEPEYYLAEVLHTKQCRMAHEDQCDWHYGSWKDTPLRGMRKIYLEKAQGLLEHVDVETALKIADLM